MKKTIFLIGVMTFLSLFSHAQDVIVKKDGSTIKCKVIEIGIEIITYKKYNYLDGPEYLIKKTDVAEIDYENGAIDIINASKEPDANKKSKTPYEDRKGYIAITLGAVAPMGDFGDQNITNPDAGLANTGFQFNLINFGYRFSKNIGIAGLWNGAAHSIEYTDDGIWSYGYFLGGLLITFPSDKVDYDLRLLGGYMNATATFPSIDVKADGNAFGVDIGALARIHYSQKMSITITLDYSAGKPSMSGNSIGSFTQRIESLSLTAGLAFRLK